MSAAIDSISIGQRFGTRVVVSITRRHRDNARAPLMRCDCGQETVASPSALLRGLDATCSVCNGRTQAAKRPRLVHGGKRTAEYRTWCKIIGRCHCETDASYPNYGKRGILVCEEWRGEGGFKRFLGHIGPRPSNRHSIDRVDNNRGYEPGNVRWATKMQQAANTRASKFITYNGETLIQNEWARRAGVDPRAFHWRLTHGWSMERALGG